MSILELKSLRSVILLLTAVILAVCFYSYFSTSQANAQWQIWYFSNIDSGEDDPDGNTVYVMYKGDNDNETANYVTIPDDEYRIWIADEAVAVGTMTFYVDATCYWNVGLGLEGADTDVDWSIGRWDPNTDTFYAMSGNTLTLCQGEYLAVMMDDSDWDLNDVNVRVTWTLYPPFVGTYIAWSCSDPPYPVPDVYSWLMFMTGAVILGLVIRHLYKRKVLVKSGTNLDLGLIEIRRHLLK